MKKLNISLIFVLLMVIVGCARFNGAHNLQDALNLGGGVATIIVDSNAPGAAADTPSGERLMLPEPFEIIFDPYSAQAWGPAGMLQIMDSSAGYDVIFSGTVSAPGYKSRDFRVRIKRLRGKEGQKSSQRIYVKLFPQMPTQVPAPVQQQQQQQQQTVIIPNNTNSSSSSCITECKKMFLKGELKDPIEQCYKLLCGGS